MGNVMRRWMGQRPGARIAVTAIVAVGLAIAAGCSDDEGDKSAGSESATTAGTATGSSQAPAQGRTSSTTSTTTTPRPIPVSKPAQRRGQSACADSTPQAVLDRYLPAFRRSTDADTANVRRALAAQLKRLPKEQRSGAAGVPLAATVYAITKPRTQRSGAYQGCLKSLIKHVQR